MNLQKVLDNAVEAGRAKEMLNSEQLTLGELILKLEAVGNKDLPIVFDEKKYKPTGLDSWRGSYRELAVQFEGGGTCYEQPDDSCERDEFGDHKYDCKCGGTKDYSTALPEKPTIQNFLDVLNLVKGKYFVGYKGGDFTMGKMTPIWVANYGSSSGFEYEDDDLYSTAIVDVKETKTKCVLITKGMN